MPKPTLTTSGPDQHSTDWFSKTGEILIIIFGFVIGTSYVLSGLSEAPDPNARGHLAAGILILVGQFICTWLVYRRWRTDRRTLLAAIFVNFTGSALSDLLDPQRNQVVDRALGIKLAMIVIFTGLLIFETVHYRKRQREDAAAASSAPSGDPS